MIGGKWTTFRAFAEQAATDVLKALGLPRIADSRTLPIGGGKDFPAERRDLVSHFQNQLGIDEDRAVHLVDHYGTNGNIVAAACSLHPADFSLAPGCSYTTGEIAYLLRHEQVVHLSDLALRRTDLAMTGQLTPDVVDAMAAIAADALDWTPERIAAERQAFATELQDYYGVTLALDDQISNRRKECV